MSFLTEEKGKRKQGGLLSPLLHPKIRDIRLSSWLAVANCERWLAGPRGHWLAFLHPCVPEQEAEQSPVETGRCPQFGKNRKTHRGKECLELGEKVRCSTADWTSDSAGKTIGCSSETWILFPAPTWWLTIIHNSIFRGSDPHSCFHVAGHTTIQAHEI